MFVTGQVTEDELHLMSKQDLDEIIEDIRLECSRYSAAPVLVREMLLNCDYNVNRADFS